MASLQCEPTGVFHIVFRISGKRYKRSLETKSEAQALVRRDEIDETIDLIKRRRLLPESSIPVVDFVLSGGDKTKLAATSKSEAIVPSTPNFFTVKELFEKFFRSLPEENLEANTINTMKTHQGHLVRHFGKHQDISKLNKNDVQEYINTRSTELTQYVAMEDGRRKKRRVSAVTIQKELTTFGTVWRAAFEQTFPNRGMRYPKIDEKPPFRTIAEISHQIQFYKFSNYEANVLWECVYLTLEEIRSLLEHVKSSKDLPALASPMMTMAAHTGARRSELIRAHPSDVNFGTGYVTVRERKRAKGMRSSRSIPMSETLANCLKTWLDIHPGGPSLFCYESMGRGFPAPLTPDQAHSIFRQAVAGTEWGKLKGWHCLRHSFISNLASVGTDQRLIDEFVGHTTDEMRRRYRHLFPDVKNAAIANVFG